MKTAVLFSAIAALMAGTAMAGGHSAPKGPGALLCPFGQNSDGTCKPGHLRVRTVNGEWKDVKGVTHVHPVHPAESHGGVHPTAHPTAHPAAGGHPAAGRGW